MYLVFIKFQLLLHIRIRLVTTLTEDKVKVKMWKHLYFFHSFLKHYLVLLSNTREIIFTQYENQKAE